MKTVEPNLSKGYESWCMNLRCKSVVSHMTVRSTSIESASRSLHLHCCFSSWPRTPRALGELLRRSRLTWRTRLVVVVKRPPAVVKLVPLQVQEDVEKYTEDEEAQSSDLEDVHPLRGIVEFLPLARVPREDREAADGRYHGEAPDRHVPLKAQVLLHSLPALREDPQDDGGGRQKQKPYHDSVERQRRLVVLQHPSRPVREHPEDGQDKDQQREQRAVQPPVVVVVVSPAPAEDWAEDSLAAGRVSWRRVKLPGPLHRPPALSDPLEDDVGLTVVVRLSKEPRGSLSSVIPPPGVAAAAGAGGIAAGRFGVVFWPLA